LGQLPSRSRGKLDEAEWMGLDGKLGLNSHLIDIFAFSHGFRILLDKSLASKQ
jgi:hypothetical protein